MNNNVRYDVSTNNPKKRLMSERETMERINAAIKNTNENYIEEIKELTAAYYNSPATKNNLKNTAQYFNNPKIDGKYRGPHSGTDDLTIMTRVEISSEGDTISNRVKTEMEKEEAKRLKWLEQENEKTNKVLKDLQELGLGPLDDYLGY